jgi:hypothetical protein
MHLQKLLKSLNCNFETLQGVTFFEMNWYPSPEPGQALSLRGGDRVVGKEVETFFTEIGQKSCFDDSVKSFADHRSKLLIPPDQSVTTPRVVQFEMDTAFEQRFIMHLLLVLESHPPPDPPLVARLNGACCPSELGSVIRDIFADCLVEQWLGVANKEDDRFMRVIYSDQD